MAHERRRGERQTRASLGEADQQASWVEGRKPGDDGGINLTKAGLLSNQASVVERAAARSRTQHSTRPGRRAKHIQAVAEKGKGRVIAISESLDLALAFYWPDDQGWLGR